MKTLSILVPVFNEKGTIRKALDRVLSVDLGGIAKEVILIDDASADGTRDVLRELESAWALDRWDLPRAGLDRIVFAYHERNQGKGAAIRTGLELATGEYTVIQDADLEYDPEDLRALLAPIQKGKAVIVYGSRFTGERRNMLFWHWVGNRFLTLVTDILYNTTLSDMETCYKMAPTELLRSLDLESDRFTIEPEMTAKFLKRGIRIYEVPISYAGREFDEGKKISWKDGLPAIWTLVKYRFVK
jgi:glycosyltransferase involved in cell wall biosynthesis